MAVSTACIPEAMTNGQTVASGNGGTRRMPMGSSGLNLRPEEDTGSFSPFAAARESRVGKKPEPGYILVVEDNSGDAELLRWSLNEHGMKQDLVVIPDGERAIRYIELIDSGAEPCPALVVLDLNLPKRTGLEVLKIIRDSAETRRIPVAVFSSSNAAKDMQDSARLGANKYIRKPSNLEDFLGVAGQLKSLMESPTN